MIPCGVHDEDCSPVLALQVVGECAHHAGGFCCFGHGEGGGGVGSGDDDVGNATHTVESHEEVVDLMTGGSTKGGHADCCLGVAFELDLKLLEIVMIVPYEAEQSQHFTPTPSESHTEQCPSLLRVQCQVHVDRDKTQPLQQRLTKAAHHDVRRAASG